MTEEELEKGITPEVLPSNELAVIIKETGLEPTLAKEFIINFEEHFRMASEWAKKATKIIVTDASQQVLMQEARIARLFLREKRLEIEKFRVSRKEYFLKGGRAIDKVANFLKDTIIPIEEHLDRQEHFVENMKKAEEARVLAEFHAKQEAEIKAKEEADRQALANLNAEREKQRKELDEVRRQADAKIAEERAKAKKAEDELRIKREAEAKAEADRIKADEALKKADDSIKLAKLMKDIQSIDYPTGLKSNKSNQAVRDVHNYLLKAIDVLKPMVIEEEI